MHRFLRVSSICVALGIMLSTVPSIAVLADEDSSRKNMDSISLLETTECDEVEISTEPSTDEVNSDVPNNDVISFESKNDEYYITNENFKLNISKEIENGLNLENEYGYLSFSPSNELLESKCCVADDAIIFVNPYGEDTSLSHIKTEYGTKEKIVLTADCKLKTLSFVIDGDNLSFTRQDSKLAFYNSKNSGSLAYITDIEIEDLNGKTLEQTVSFDIKEKDSSYIAELDIESLNFEENEIEYPISLSFSIDMLDLNENSINTLSVNDDFTNATTLYLNTTVNVNITGTNSKNYYKFIPSSTGFYTFESTAISTGDPCAWLYNSSRELLKSDDDISTTQRNYRLTYHFVAGKTYYFVSGSYSNVISNYNFTVSNTSSDSLVQASVLNSLNTFAFANSKSFESTVYRFTPSETGEYLFFSSEYNSDPIIWIYNSNLSQLGYNDDCNTVRNFRYLQTYNAGETYYIVLGNYNYGVGSFTVNHYKSADINTSVHYIRNNGSAKYMDIEGPADQGWVHQWTAHIGSQEKWTFQRQSDGYYTIKTSYGSNNYIGISSSETETDNIKLYSSVSDNTKWKIYEFNDKHLLFEPKNAIGKVLYVPNSATGTRLQLSLMGDSVSDRNHWKINSYYAQVYNYFDDGYSVYYGESRSTSINRINGYLSEIANRYYDLLDLTIIFGSAEYYNSPIDICKGVVNSSNINTLCNHTRTIHSERSNVISSFNNNFTGSNTITNVLWSDHQITSTATNGNIDYNRSCSSGTSIIMIERSTSTNRDYNSKSVLMHELNHQYGAKDHYHELANLNDPNSCKFKERCSECGNNPRPSSCIMNLGRMDITDDNVICPECQTDILSHLSGHHSN